MLNLNLKLGIEFLPARPAFQVMINFDAMDYTAGAIAACALVAAMVEELEPAARSRLIAAAEAKLASPDGLLPTDQRIRARTIDLIRTLR
jgi:tellurite resistance protein